jgi:hypothetical protein
MLLIAIEMSAQIEARKNQMITELTNLKTKYALWERSKFFLNDEYERKLLETIQSTNDALVKGANSKVTEEPTKRIIEQYGVRYYINGDDEVFNMKRTYVGFWIQPEGTVFFEDNFDKDDDEEYDEEYFIKTPEQTGPKQPANPLGLFLEFPVIEEDDDEDTMCAKYEQELDREISMMKEKLVKIKKVYGSRIAKLEKRIDMFYKRIRELESLYHQFETKISNIKMKRIKEFTEIANSIWTNK